MSLGNPRRVRKAISPIIAIVLIIAVTLIASVAVGGFVFGLFGSSASVAQVQATSAQISLTVTSGGVASVSCTPTAPGSNFVTLTNSGTASTSVTLFVIQFEGTTNTVSPAGSCAVAAGTSLYLSILQITGATPTKGVQFSGYASLNGGAQVVFTGAFT